MTIEDLTPAERDEVQMVYLRRWLASKLRKGTRRKGDWGGVVTCFTMSGDRVNEPRNPSRLYRERKAEDGECQESGCHNPSTRYRCDDCRAKHTERTRLQRVTRHVSSAESQRKYRARKAAAGQCQMNRCDKPATGARCDDCRMRVRAQHAERERLRRVTTGRASA